jgi:7-carboxy-7-deazaguanine synthase
MTYSVKEVFLTLQGEGANTGRLAVFCRFAGCNLWSGLERDRAKAVCRFCDTDFVGTDGTGGGKFKEAKDLAAAVSSLWPNECNDHRLVVCTGGEPLLQLDEVLIRAFHEHGFQVAVETNGTLPAPEGLDWICVSPKGVAPVVLQSGDELKLVYPQTDAQPEAFVGMAFDHFFLQPMDGPNRDKNTQLTVDYCKTHPKWRLGLQTHKILGIP